MNIGNLTPNSYITVHLTRSEGFCRRASVTLRRDIPSQIVFTLYVSKLPMELAEKLAAIQPIAGSWSRPPLAGIGLTPDFKLAWNFDGCMHGMPFVCNVADIQPDNVVACIQASVTCVEVWAQEAKDHQAAKIEAESAAARLVAEQAKAARLAKEAVDLTEARYTVLLQLIDNNTAKLNKKITGLTALVNEADDLREDVSRELARLVSHGKT